MSYLNGNKSSPLFVCFMILVVVLSGACGNAQTAERTANGVLVHTSSGITRVEVCSERVIHVVAGSAAATTNQPAPNVTRPCNGTEFTVSSDGTGSHLHTTKLNVDIAGDTGSVRFAESSGNTLLNEQPNAMRNMETGDDKGRGNEIERRFLLSADEALYGLGQHQEGFLNLRGIPIRLLQANTDIAIPFLISTRGYGLLWNNAAMTDFNPADRWTKTAPRHFEPAPMESTASSLLGMEETNSALP